MIVDQLNQGELYGFGPAWEMALEFLRSIDADHEEGQIQLQGEEIFARIMSYDTQAPEVSKVEAHNVYVDIQMTLRGAEGIDWWLRETLPIKQDYDELRDVLFFDATEIAPRGRADLHAGYFAVFFPHDAHRPKQMVGGQSEHIKKVVVKIKRDLLLGHRLEA